MTISDCDQFGTVNSLLAKVDGWCDSGFAFVSSIVSKTAVCQLCANTLKELVSEV